MGLTELKQQRAELPNNQKRLKAGSETLPTLFDPRALYCNFLPKNRMAPDLLVSVTPPA
jgi:hypothetical protein